MSRFGRFAPSRRSSRSTLRDHLRPSDDDRPPFVEGLILGAMVGAAVAGSTLWTRMRESRRHRVPAPPADSHGHQG